MLVLWRNLYQQQRFKIWVYHRHAIPSIHTQKCLFLVWLYVLCGGLRISTMDWPRWMLSWRGKGARGPCCKVHLRLLSYVNPCELNSHSMCVRPNDFASFFPFFFLHAWLLKQISLRINYHRSWCHRVCSFVSIWSSAVMDSSSPGNGRCQSPIFRASFSLVSPLLLPYFEGALITLSVLILSLFAYPGRSMHSTGVM